jgi:predicted AlkP superfamily pyrophosphatase or phosphodiesterase
MQETVVEALSVTVTSAVQPRRAIIIVIDALRRDAFEDSLSNMPYTNEYIVGNGVRFSDATTIFPSITLAGHASIFTGNWPGKHEVTGKTKASKSRPW